MEYTDPYIRELQTLSGVPEEGMRMLFGKGIPLTISSMTILNTPSVLEFKSYYFTEGIVREFYTDKSGNEHTMRFVQAPAIITPSSTDYYINSETIITCQSLTPLIGMFWVSKEIEELQQKYPEFYKLSLNRKVRALHIKNIKEIRRHQFSAAERYLLFLEDFSGLVNQVSLKYIASYLNITPETISRIRAEISKNSIPQK